MIRRFSPAAFLVLLFAAVTLAAPADALVVCQRDKRPGRFKIRAACKPRTETAVHSFDTAENPPESPVDGPNTTAPPVADTPITHIFNAHEATGTLLEGYEEKWVEFGSPRNYENTPPPAIIAVAVDSVPSFSFHTRGTSDIAITFTAQCRINAPTGRSLRVRFELDGASLHPNENEPNLCRSHTPASNLSVSVTYAIEGVPEGPHRISALAHFAGFDGEDAILFGKDLVVVVSERP